MLTTGMLAVGLFLAGCSGAAASPMVHWSSPPFPYEGDAPAGFSVSLATADRVDLTWGASGDVLRLELVPAVTTPPTAAFDTACGSHECTSSLVVVRGDLRCTYMDRFSTDVFDDEPTEDELEARLEPILRSLRRRP
ncbi:MAG: hypothetical protein K1X94_09460 [Sandaracinaceae bacterium]|nr:hypothetical protein [Sandaracinaceae bacterium]